MDANATDLCEPLGGMAPEEIGDAGLLEKLQMLQCPDVLAHGGPQPICHTAGGRCLQCSPMAEAIYPSSPGEGKETLCEQWIVSGGDCLGRRKFSCIGLLPEELVS